MCVEPPTSVHRRLTGLAAKVGEKRFEREQCGHRLAWPDSSERGRIGDRRDDRQTDRIDRRYMLTPPHESDGSHELVSFPLVRFATAIPQTTQECFD